VVSFFSPSGYEVVSKRKDAPVCFYLPAATPKNANMLLNVLNAEMIFFVKYEFWWSYFIEAHKRKIPLYLVCSVFRKNQYFFKWYGQTYLKMLQLFDWIFTQNNESVGLLKSKQIEHCSYSGDTRYDRVMKIASSPKEIPEIKLFKQNSPLIVAGSSYTTEDNLIKEALLKNSELKAVIAPHHIDEKRIGEIVATFAAFKPCRYTHHQVDENSRVLILDTIGLLSSAYAYADAALVGGGFGHKGLHNIIEPCVFGIPVFFGPNHHRFHEARYLIDMGCAFEINHDDDFVPKLQSTFQPENRTAIKNICKRVFENNAGVTPSILKAIDELRNKF
jgi:3-deoxy-D-manno-octulosonic-acid transferase